MFAMTLQFPHGDADVQNRFDTEQGLIGALLGPHGVPLFHQCRAVIGPENFTEALFAAVFDRLEQGIANGLTNFPLVAFVMSELRDNAMLKDANFPVSAFIARCCANACPAIGAEGSARQIKYDWCNDALKEAVADGDTESAQKHAAEMDQLSRAHLNRADTFVSLGTVTDQVVARINDAYMAGKPPQQRAFCGSHDLGRAIGGWQRGRFYVIAGRPSMGKTTSALSLLLRTAHKGHGVLFVSLEMGSDELSSMALSSLARSQGRRVEYRDVSPEAVMEPGFRQKLETIVQMRPLMNSMPFMVDDRAGLTVADIRAAASQHAQRLEAMGSRLEVLCIDHLGLIKPSSRYAGNKVAETEETSMSLKQLAKDLDIAVVSLVQLNRGVEGREDKRPGLSDLRWSGAIEQDADVVMFVYRESYYLERRRHDDQVQEVEREHKLKEKQNVIELIIAKQRGGTCPIVDLYCDMGCAFISDMERAHG